MTGELVLMASRRRRVARIRRGGGRGRNKRGHNDDDDDGTRPRKEDCFRCWWGAEAIASGNGPQKWRERERRPECFCPP